MPATQAWWNADYEPRTEAGTRPQDVHLPNVICHPLWDPANPAIPHGAAMRCGCIPCRAATATIRDRQERDWDRGYVLLRSATGVETVPVDEWVRRVRAAGVT